jgi:bacteriorhodopsin
MVRYKARVPGWLLPTFALCHVDWKPPQRPPTMRRLAVATVVSIAGALAADAVLVSIGTKVFPGTTGYTHFRFADYARLTVIGVVIACAAWPVVARITSTPRWLFFRMAIVVTVVLWAPDVYLLAKHQPADAVAVLMLMHLAIAVVTYSALVHLSPVRQGTRAAFGERDHPPAATVVGGVIEEAPAARALAKEDAGTEECDEEETVRS